MSFSVVTAAISAAAVGQALPQSSASGMLGWLVPALLLWPILAAAVVRIAGRDESGARDARRWLLAALVVEAVLGLLLWTAFDSEGRGWQGRVDWPWLVDIGASFSVGVDGISLAMTVMTVVVLPLALVASWDNVRVRTPAFAALSLLLTSGIVGIFVSLDLLLFYLSWELMLIPMYFLIGVWGSGASARASLRYVLFTLVGSLLMLVAIVVLWTKAGGTSLHIDDLLAARLDPRTQLFMFLAFFTAFAVKSGLVPFHTWMPDAQRSAPIFVAVALALKVGTYAILRFAIPLFPAAATMPAVRSTILILSVIGILYGAFIAMSQRDLRRMIAYTSISHLGFIMLGAFALTQQSVQGAVLIMINHGISTSALFLMAGMLEDRLGTGEFAQMGGLARGMPLFAIVFGVAVFATVGLPGTNGFVGEFLVLIGTFADWPGFAIAATAGVILAAIYGMRVLQSVLFERPATDRAGSVRDLSARELLPLAALTAGVIWLGVAPAPVLRRIEVASRGVIEAARFGPNAAPVRTADAHASTTIHAGVGAMVGDSR